MKFKIKTIITLIILCFSFNTEIFAEDATNNSNLKESIKTEISTQNTQNNDELVINKDKIMEQSKQISPEKVIQKARNESVNWVYYAVILFAVLFIIGVFVRPVLKFASFFALSVGIGYFLLHDTESVVAILFSVIDKIEGFLTFN